jgi:hypothetical protein
MEMIRAGDIPGTTGTGTRFVDRRLHRGSHRGVLAHAKIIIAAPNRYAPYAVCCVVVGRREFTAMPQNVRKYAIAPFAL